MENDSSDAVKKKSDSWVLLSALFQVAWEMRWGFLGFALLLVGIHFAIEYADVLIPNRKPFSLFYVCVAIVLGWVVIWSHISGAQKRISKLQEKVESLEAKIAEHR